ncbi:tetratricopeptide repeat-containing sensor histidine kinase [Flavihumibacter fluvii]|uniref:tetratricopeptide repeat-containing sensor histidine kinase n=1 Tax=Flavihumibacter fluvii TaxID=2838157 RepID=UPI001BDE2669|nr:ATP-binding protein [Flavihumibacter fluvii]ULQ50920.1 ATP-binding protein [Flavihumibacter fluvii]
MKRLLLLIAILVNIISPCYAQIVNPPPGYLDSLKYESVKAKDDTSRVLALSYLSWTYSYINFDTASMYSQEALNIAQKIKFYKGEIRSLYALGQAFLTKGELAKALDLFYKGLQIAEKNNCQLEKAACLTQIGNVYSDLNDWPKAISYYIKANKINDIVKNEKGTEDVKFLTDINIGWAYAQTKQLDSALVYLENLNNRTLNNKYWHPAVLMFFGDIQFRLGKHQVAIEYVHQSLEIFQSRKDHFATADACIFLAVFFKELNQADSCIYYAEQGLREAQIISYTTRTLLISKLLAEQYETRDINRAHFYLKIAMAANDELYGSNKVQDLQKILFDEQERQRQAEAERVAYGNRLKQYLYIAGLAVVLLIAFFLYRNNRLKQKANRVLQQQKDEIALQKTRAEKTLAELSSTQAQLIQSEKMASLGELTAGIAHEIQNPLNFVNNFSEVNKELLVEMQEAMDKGDLADARALAIDVIANQEKINHHGKRADSIVKGMLQHSRETSSIKEPTDINKLADEYTSLAYHGLRAKEKSFNATLHTDFDETIGKINTIPQDIGRVILNLVNNAFYAVDEKKKQQPTGYDPTVSLTTKKTNGKVTISVKDNGNGIPKKVIDKIFQPFFTTKPTGQGTGLGLSLSYDIIKAHGGEIKVETKEGEGTEFNIKLPMA